MNKSASNVISWIAQIGAIVIMGQSLFFKFTAHPESVAIFSDIGMEPNGRILIGVVELFACLLLLRPASAIVGHFTQIGWHGEWGQLGIMAVLVLVLCVVILYIRRMDLPFIKVALEESQRRDATSEED